MARHGLRATLLARFEHALDGVPDLLSYLAFTSLERRTPALARAANRLLHYRRKRTWLLGRIETENGPVAIAHLGTPDRLALWLLDRLGAKSLRTARAKPMPGSVACDVELVLFPAAQARDWSRAGWLVLPRYVRHRQVLDDPSAFERRIARRVRDRGMTLRLSRDRGDLDYFRRELYDPMLARRHGDRALRTGHALLRFGQRRGGLFLVELDGRVLAGALAVPHALAPGEVEIWAVGVAENAPSGAVLAAVLGCVEWARDRGFAAVDHVASLPLFSDGLTQQKLRWGTVLHVPSESHALLAVRCHGNGPALRSWLGRHSFAACSNGRLIRVDVADSHSLPEIARELAIA